MQFLLPTWLIPSGREGPSQVPETLAPVPFPSPPRAHGIGPESEQMGARRDGGWRGRQREGRGRSPERTGWRGGRGMTAAGTPAERGGAGRQVPARLRRRERGQLCGSRLARRDGHISLQRLAEAAALPTAPGTQDSGRAALKLPVAHPQTAPRVRALGAPQPSSRCPLRLRPLPAAESCAARFAGPAPAWGRGSTTKSGDGPPTGHRAAPRGLTNPEDRQRWV